MKIIPFFLSQAITWQVQSHCVLRQKHSPESNVYILHLKMQKYKQTNKSKVYKPNKRDVACIRRHNRGFRREGNTKIYQRDLSTLNRAGASEFWCFNGGLCLLCSLFEGVCVHCLVLSLRGGRLRPSPSLAHHLPPRHCPRFRKRPRCSESRHCRCRRNWRSRLLNWSKPQPRGKCSGSVLEINTARLRNRNRSNYIIRAMSI